MQINSLFQYKKAQYFYKDWHENNTKCDKSKPYPYD